MTTTDTRNKLGITVARALRTVMQGKVAIAGEASYEGARQVFNVAVVRQSQEAHWPVTLSLPQAHMGLPQ
jgi:hypothetical protein